MAAALVRRGLRDILLVVSSLVVSCLLAPELSGADCNGNGVADERDLLAGTSRDCDGDLTPDECELQVPHSTFVEGPSSASDAEFSDMAAVDLDGDGDLDLVVAEGRLGGATIAIFENAGGGRFEIVHRRATVEWPSRAAAGDLDRDGDLDLFFADLLGSRVLVFENRGGLEFELAAPVAAGPTPSCVAAGDLDADGDLDLATGSVTTRRAGLLLGRADGSFEEPVFFDLGFLPGTLQARDLDRDGDLDLLFGEHSSAVARVFWNDGSASFGPGPVARWESTGPEALARVDLDLDGEIDAWIGGSPPTVVELAAGRLVAPPAREGSGTWIAGDFDGDLDVDFLQSPWPAAGPQALFHENLGDDTFSSLELPVSSALFAADMDGDGWLDVLGTRKDRSSLVTLWNRPVVDGTDCDGDGRPDGCQLGPEDCNRNGVPDACDIARGTSEDCNRNAVPDECDTLGRHHLAAPRWVRRFPIEDDLDGDGDIDGLDVETDSAGRHLLASWLDVGDGRYRLVGRLPLGTSPPRITTGDFDGDGFPDVLHATADELRVLSGRGDGTFVLRSETSLENEGVEYLFSMELDGDGDLDLLLKRKLPAAGGRISREFLRNRGRGSFEGPFSAPGVVLEGARSIQVADFDGDGLPDIALADRSVGGILLLRNLTGGRFESRFLTNARPADVIRAIDFDRDGDLDLVSMLELSESHIVDLLSQRDDGSFERRELLFATGDTVPLDLDARGYDGLRRGSSLALADFDHDGDADIALAFADTSGPLSGGTELARSSSGTRDGGVRIFLQSLPMSFREGERAPFGWLPPGSGLEAVDFDRDGAVDLRLGPLLMRGRADGTFESVARVGIHRQVAVLAASDFTGDGLEDLAIVGLDDRVEILAGRRSLDFEVAGAFPVGSRVWKLLAGELDGDGRPDLVAVAQFPGRFQVFTNRGEAGFVAGERIALDSRYRPLLAAADFDADGLEDLVILQSANLEIWRNQGEGRFLPVTNFPALFAPIPGETGHGVHRTVDDLVAGDFDGDGLADFAAVAGARPPRDGVLYVWRQIGALTFQRLAPVRQGARVPFVARDLDRDGRVELVAMASRRSPYSWYRASVAVFRTAGGGALEEETDYDIATVPSVYPVGDWRLAAGDFDGDRWPDVAVVFTAGDNAAILRGRAGDRPSSLDLDRDGRPDECQPALALSFLRGDVNQDGEVELEDALELLAALFLAGPRPRCAKAADATDDGAIDLSDPVRILLHLFRDGGDLPAPFPLCGPDPTRDELDCQEEPPCGP